MEPDRAEAGQREQRLAEEARPADHEDDKIWLERRS